MSDDGKCYAATPAATLEEHILNSNIAKSDTEWWAHREITRLRADLAAVIAERDRLREAVRAESERAYNEGRASRRAVVAAGHALFIYAQKAANKIKRHSLEKLLPSPDDELLAFIRAVDESSKSDSARAALEGVTEPPR